MQNILFLCTGNSATSIMAEAYMNSAPGERFKAFSAGSLPNGGVNLLALEVLVKHGISVDRAESKPWNMFSFSSAPRMDYVITLCDKIADEVCPIWPGHPVKVHWSIPDPAAVKGMRLEQLDAFENIFSMICKRVDQFLLQNRPPSLLAECCAQGEVIMFD